MARCFLSCSPFTADFLAVDHVQHMLLKAQGAACRMRNVLTSRDEVESASKTKYIRPTQTGLDAPRVSILPHICQANNEKYLVVPTFRTILSGHMNDLYN